jgi:hypothetical protein
MSVSNYNGGENGPQIPVPPDYNPNGPPGQQGTWPEDLQVSCGIGCIACNQNTSTPAANCQGCCNACFPQPSGIFPLIKWSNAIKACKTACLATGGLWNPMYRITIIFAALICGISFALIVTIADALSFIVVNQITMQLPPGLGFLLDSSVPVFCIATSSFFWYASHLLMLLHFRSVAGRGDVCFGLRLQIN